MNEQNMSESQDFLAQQAAGAADGPREQVVRHTITVDQTNPLWRLLGVGALLAGVFVVATALQETAPDLVQKLATIIAIALGFLITTKLGRLSNLSNRLGAWGKVGSAVKESQGEIAQWLRTRSDLVTLGLGLLKGLAIVISSTLIYGVLTAISSPLLAGGIGLIVASAIVLPGWWAKAGKKLAQKNGG